MCDQKQGVVNRKKAYQTLAHGGNGDNNCSEYVWFP